MKERIVTIADIEEDLCELDSEYREALAEGLKELNYISNYPLQLQYGTVVQQRELEKAWNRPLKPKEIKEIIEYIDNKMRCDFQYRIFKEITSFYNKYMTDKSKDISKKKNSIKERWF